MLSSKASYSFGTKTGSSAPLRCSLSPFFLTTFLAFFFVWNTVGCSKKQDKVVEATKGRLQEGIKRCRKRPNLCRTSYIIPAYQRALEVLESGISLDPPVPFIAIFFQKVYHDSPVPRCLCFLDWLDEDFDVRGLALVDEAGTHWRYDLFKWSAEDKEEFDRTLWLGKLIGVDVKGVRSWRQPPSLAKYPTELITVPPEIFRGKLKVGLITNDGKESELIDAWIAADFLADPCNPSPPIPPLRAHN